MKKLSEDAIQAEYHKWLWNTYPMTRKKCYAIPNGGLRIPTEAVRLQATGTLAGVCDYHHAIPAGGFASLYIEFKEPGANMNTDHVKKQLKVHESLREAGNKVVICTSVLQAQNELHEYLKETPWLT